LRLEWLVSQETRAKINGKIKRGSRAGLIIKCIPKAMPVIKLMPFLPDSKAYRDKQKYMSRVNKARVSVRSITVDKT
jgi:hypothetical protein